MTKDPSEKFGEFRLMLYPKNLKLLREFYEKTLGCKVTHEWNNGKNDQGIMFAVGNTTLELISPEDEYTPVTGCELSIEVDDVWKVWKRFEGKGNVIFGIRKNEWGDTSFCITDPENLKITFFTRHE